MTNLTKQEFIKQIEGMGFTAKAGDNFNLKIKNHTIRIMLFGADMTVIISNIVNEEREFTNYKKALTYVKFIMEEL